MGIEENNNTFSTPTEAMLNAPLWQLDFSVRLYSMLNTLKCKTLGEILQQYEKKDLVKKRTFRKKSLMEFEEYLKDHNCFHLWRD